MECAAGLGSALHRRSPRAGEDPQLGGNHSACVALAAPRSGAMRDRRVDGRKTAPFAEKSAAQRQLAGR